ncbi:MAG: hypothetical protein KAR07_08165 [Spirochaetes bacterium]|nr:hypothetical protein [Spirochaetota bacterium]MCK5268127.1 hypothetical protein [Spirochaetota bacterium]
MLWLVLACLLSGFIAASIFLIEKIPALEPAKRFTPVLSVPVGLFSIMVGIIKFFSPSVDFRATKDGVKYLMDTSAAMIFLGDLMPAIAAILAGMVCSVSLLKFINIDQEKKNSIESKLSMWKVPIGLLAIIAGLVHLVTWDKAFF